MQILLACAKTMVDSTRVATPAVSTPRFAREAGEFAIFMMQLSASDIAKMLRCSSAIAAQTLQRYGSFFEQSELLPAVLAYHGQAYRGLRAEEFSLDDMAFAQDHLHITSFLYGLLRPLDMIHPYRMEGNAELAPAEGENLFAYWRKRLTQCLIDAVKADDGVLVHLATEEMEHLFDWRRIKQEVRMIQPQFLVRKDGKLKVVTVYAKTCRGAMTRHIITNRLATPESLASFCFEGFEFSPENSTPDTPVFICE